MTPTQIKKLAEGIKSIADTTGELLQLASEVALSSMEEGIAITTSLEEISSGLTKLMNVAKKQSNKY